VIDMGQKALWSGRFENDMDDSVLEFTSSLDHDRELAFYDIMGSLAHVTMLKKCKIVDESYADEMIEGLRMILSELKEGEFDVDDEFEDIHTNIENALTKLIGPIGGKLHTGRSRNDQVAVDMRMYMRDVVLEIVKNINDLMRALVNVAQDSSKMIMPGFTHMQHAQPVTVAQHMMAHAFRLNRDAERFVDAFERMNVCPLGAAALAGTTYPINRKQTSDLLGFRMPSENSMDSVSDRDFVIETVFCSSMLALHLSSMAEELVLWSTTEFGFIEMDDKYTTGSSIMPQKKNPDIAELIRGRTGGVVGSLVSMITMMKGLPLSYNRDMQEDKSLVMGSLDTVMQCTMMMSRLVSTIKFDADRMLKAASEGYMNATDLADYLVNKGIPFREAHAMVGSAVRYCILEKRGLDQLTLSEMKGFSDAIEKDVFDILPIEQCVERRNSLGGTSSQSVEAQIFDAMAIVVERDERLRLEISLLDKCWDELTG